MLSLAANFGLGGKRLARSRAGERNDYVGWLLEETIAASWLSGCSSLTPGRGHDIHTICILDGTYRRTRFLLCVVQLGVHLQSIVRVTVNSTDVQMLTVT